MKNLLLAVAAIALQITAVQAYSQPSPQAPAPSQTQPQTQTQPASDAARYLLRPGDTLSLQYRITPEFNQTVVIAPDGYVDLYVAGETRVGGLTVAQAHDQILARESEHLNNPELSISLADFEKPFVVVAGEVATPGKVLLRQNLTALQAVMLAGGWKDSSHTSQVVLLRRVNNSQMAEVHVLDLHKVRKVAQLHNDMALESGDMLYVPINKLAVVQRYVRLNPVGLGFNVSSLY